MTPDRLAEIKERAEKATPGPWEAAGALVYRWEGQRQHIAVTRYPDKEEADAEFIAYSRSDVLALLSIVEAQTRVVEAARHLLGVYLYPRLPEEAAGPYRDAMNALIAAVAACTAEKEYENE